MSGKKSGLYIGGLLIVFIIVIFVGRFFYSPNDNSTKIGPPQYSVEEQGNGNVSQDSSSNTTDTQTNSTSAASDDPEAALMSCATSLKRDTEFKQTTYEKGTILVTFKEGVTFSTAKSVLATYDIKILNETNAQASYPNRRLLTGIVKEGDEFIKICIVKNNPAVVYAGVNPTFTLHD